MKEGLTRHATVSFEQTHIISNPDGSICSFNHCLIAENTAVLLCLAHIVKHYGLDGLGIKSQWGQDFLHPSRLALGLTQPPVQWLPGLFPGLKWPVCGIDHPPRSSAELKEE